ncbi:MAG: hypothetical protein R3B97_03390 [Dehalococcoidia bacterium]|nr:hypothetical protein [Dehalococcoidia bacterium]MCB9485014.1 hypothetical protein [Thermoflexaceae bacterium]
MRAYDQTTFADFMNRVWAGRNSFESILGLHVVEVGPDSVRSELAKSAFSWVAETGAWGGEALDLAMSFTEMALAAYEAEPGETGMIRYALGSRVTRYFRASGSARVHLTARVRYRGRARLVIESWAEDDAGRELLRADSEHLLRPQPFPFNAPS